MPWAIDFRNAPQSKVLTVYKSTIKYKKSYLYSISTCYVTLFRRVFSAFCCCLKDPLRCVCLRSTLLVLNRSGRCRCRTRTLNSHKKKTESVAQRNLSIAHSLALTWYLNIYSVKRQRVFPRLTPAAPLCVCELTTTTRHSHSYNCARTVRVCCCSEHIFNKYIISSISFQLHKLHK